MNEELKQKAENFIIDRYKIAERYREDNVETREYMRMDVHSQYEEEYQLYLDATKELQEQIDKMKAELHHRLVSPSHDDSDCLDKIVGLDRLWQFGQEF